MMNEVDPPEQARSPRNGRLLLGTLIVGVLLAVVAWATLQDNGGSAQETANRFVDAVLTAAEDDAALTLVSPELKHGKSKPEALDSDPRCYRRLRDSEFHGIFRGAIGTTQVTPGGVTFHESRIRPNASGTANITVSCYRVRYVLVRSGVTWDLVIQVDRLPASVGPWPTAQEQVTDVILTERR
jgi:hypothetical protein